MAEWHNNGNGRDKEIEDMHQHGRKYDLISGLVKRVDYQPGKAEQFAHKYFYDADNRLRNVYTSRDNGYTWREEAEYFYYLHGPLSRVEYGDNKVQGMDYAYTLQGWIKFGNLPHRRTANLNTADIGKDGTLPGDVNQYVGMDEFAFGLGYYNGDYSPITAGANQGLASGAHTAMAANINGSGLYNGNITWMATQLNNLAALKNDGTPDEYGIRVGAYKYDQLNRLTKSRSYGYINNSGAATSTFSLMHNGSTGNNRWRADYSYDANGNLRTAYVTNGSVIMDNFTYKYGSVSLAQKLTTINRLTQVSDAAVAGSAAVVGDIDNGQLANNYQYDAIGNLIKDVQETTDIEWNVYGKVKKVTRTNNGTYITFTYDAAGQRVRKALYLTSGNVLQSETYYVRDAAGNVLNTYVKQGANTAAEYSIYGATRIGTKKEFYTGDPTVPAGTMSENRPHTTVYELTNHLGNVNAVISGLKIGAEGPIVDSKADVYKTSVLSLMDYYPFGMTMLDRQHNDNSYRYGFNNQEKEADSKSFDYDFGARMYDSRLGRWLAVDPMAMEYTPVSPYIFALNNPLVFKDGDGRIVIGLDGKPVTYTKNSDGTIEWSSNATEDIKLIGGAMLKTKFGEKSFNKWQEMSTIVTLKLNITRNPKVNYAVSKFGLFRNKDENGFYKKAKIIIYLKTIKEDKDRFSNIIDLDEGLGAVAVHESWHADPDQINRDRMQPDELSQSKLENLPLNSEVNFRAEYRKNAGVDDTSLRSLYNKYDYHGLNYNDRPIIEGGGTSNQGAPVQIESETNLNYTGRLY